ncbi:hypothetical protein ACSN7O_004808 [Enterobacter chuandaensis]
MNMMQKMSLLALAVCAAGAVSTVARADDKSWGTASAKVTVNAAQEWKIEKVNDGSFNIGTDGKLTDGAAGGNAAGVHPEFKVTNNSQAAGVFYIQGNGSSLDPNNNIMVYNDEDATKRFKVIPKYTADSSIVQWDGTKNKYKGNSLAAGGSVNFAMYLKTDAKDITPGSYTVTLELFAPSV